MLVFTATSLFDAVRSVLNKVYRLQRTRGLFLTFVHDIGFVLLVFFLFVGVNLITWGLSLLEGLAAESPLVALLGLERITRYLPTGFVLVVAAIMFYIVFFFIPDARPSKRAAVVSTL